MAQDQSETSPARAVQRELLRGGDQCLMTLRLYGQGDIRFAVLSDASGHQEIIHLGPDVSADDDHDISFGGEGNKDRLYGGAGDGYFECPVCDDDLVYSFAISTNNPRVAERSRQRLLSSTSLNRAEAVPLDLDASESTDNASGSEEIEQLLAAVAEGSTADEGARSSASFDEDVFWATVQVLGGDSMLGASVQSELDLLRAIVRGFPCGVLGRLRDAGFSSTVLEDVVAPRRTLARRKAERQRLTQGESDAVWRIAHVFALASIVLDGPGAAHAWLDRPKSALAGEVPLALLNTSVGARAVERLLRQLEWGNVA